MILLSTQFKRNVDVLLMAYTLFYEPTLLCHVYNGTPMSADSVSTVSVTRGPKLLSGNLEFISRDVGTNVCEGVLGMGGI